MKHNTLKIRLMGALICLALIFSGTTAWGIGYTLSLQTTDGAAARTTFLQGQDLYLNININDMTGVAGAAFTLVYPATILEFEGTDASGVSTGVYSPVFTFVQGTTTTKTHRENAPAGKIMLSGATIDTTGANCTANPNKGGSAYTGTKTLFTIRFKVKVDAAISDSTFSLEKTWLTNTDAGYASGGEEIPVLIGAVPCSDAVWGTLTSAFPTLDGAMTPLPATANFAVIDGSLINDNVPPTGTIAINEASPTKTGTVTLNLTAADNLGIITEMQFKNETGGWSAPVPFAATKTGWLLTNGDGVKTVYAKFKDAAGNWSIVEIKTTITLDKTAPVTTAVPLAGVYNAAQNVVLATTDVNPGPIYYTTNGTIPTTASAVYGGAINIAANTTLKYFSVDLAGNAELVKTSVYTFEITPPAGGTLKINANALYTKTKVVTLTLTSPTDASGISKMKFSNDNWASESAEEAFALTKAGWNLDDSGGDGVKTVWVKFMDKAGNWTTVPVNDAITLDTTKPDVTAVTLAIAGGAGYTKVQAVTLTINQAPAETNGPVTMRFRNEAGVLSAPQAFALTKAGWSLSAGNGLKTVSVVFVDQAGNESDPVQDTITFDNILPVTTATPVAGVFNAAQNVVLATPAEVNPGPIYYTTNGSIPTTASTLYVGAINIAATTTLKYFSVDLAGNAEAVKTSVYTIETTLPVGGSVKINANALFTKTKVVALTLTSPTDASGISKMKFSNDNWVTESVEEAFALTKAGWNLDDSGGDGVKTVWVKFMDKAGNWTTVPVNDAITLDTTKPDVTAVTLAIAGGAGYTKVQAVTLTINQAPAETNGPVTMRFRNEAGVLSAPQAFALTKAGWSLSAGNGLKTVSVVFVDQAGNESDPVQDTITFDNILPVTTATPVAGVFNAAQNVVLATPAEVNPGPIYYTTNGSIPTTASTLYVGAINIAATTTLKYFSVDLAGNAEAVKTSVYTIETTLPVGGSVKINANALFTKTKVVALTLTSPTDASGISKMKFSNDNWASESAEEAFALTKAGWNLDDSGGDGLKTVWVKFKDKAGNWTTVAVNDTITLDTAKPDVAGATLTINAGAAFTKSATVNLGIAGAVDPTSGLFQMQFSNDNVTWSVLQANAATKTGWLLPALNGLKTVYVRFTDNAGNVPSDPVSDTITLDTVIPVTTAVPLAGVYNAAQNVVLATTDVNPGPIYYTTNGTIPTTASAVYGGAINIAANTTLKYFSVDLAGNAELVKTSVYTFEITPPAGGTLKINANALFTKTKVVALTLTSPTDASGISKMKFSNDNWVTESVEEAFALTKAGWNLDDSGGDGVKTVWVKFMDKAGNWTTVPVNDAITLDTTKPDVTAVTLAIAGGAGYTKVQAVTLTINQAPAETNGPVTMRFRNEAGVLSAPQAFALTKAGWSLSAGNGLKTVSVVFVDQAGNESDPVQDTITFDNILPVTTATPVAGVFNAAQNVVLATPAEVNPGPIYYTTNGSIPTTASTLYVGAINIAATTTLKYFSVDLAGNAEAVKTSVYTIETTLPVGGSVKINANALFTKTKVVALTLTSPTDASGISKMKFSNDNWVTESVEEAFALTKAGWNLDDSGGDGVKTVWVKFMDKAGNWTTVPVNDAITLDTTKPDVTAVTLAIAGGAGYTKVQAVTLTINQAPAETNGPVTMRFRNEAGVLSAPQAFALTKAGWSLSAGNGLKTVSVVFVDQAGNESDPVQDTITFDNILPVTTATPVAGVFNAAQNVVLATPAEVNPGPIYYTTNGSIPTTASTLYVGAINIAATTTLKYFSVDLAGNAEAVKTSVYTIETTLPVGGSVKINANALFTKTKVVALTLTSPTDASGISKMKFSNDNWVTESVEEAFALTKAGWNLDDSGGDGVKTVWVKFMDKAGNWTTVPVNDAITLDTTKPDGTLRIIGNCASSFEKTTLTTVTLNPSSTDNLSPAASMFMKFSNNLTTWSAYEAYKTTRTGWALTAGNGVKIVYAMFKDAAGNESEAVYDTITLASSCADAATFEYGKGVSTDLSGNVFLVGSAGTTDFGTRRVSWVKSDINANMQTTSLELAGYTFGDALAVDGQGSVYSTGVDAESLYLMKYDASGFEKWAVPIGTASDNVAALGVNRDGELYVARPATGGEISLSVYSGEGIEQSVRSLALSSGYAVRAVTMDTAGNSYLAGATEGILDTFVAKFDAFGNQQWIKQLGATANSEGYGLATDGGGNVYVTGYVEGSLRDEANAGHGDCFLAKYSPAGDELWVKLSGSSAHDWGSAVAVDGSGNVYVTGATGVSLDGKATTGGYEMFLLKYNASGMLQ